MKEHYEIKASTFSEAMVQLYRQFREHNPYLLKTKIDFNDGGQIALKAGTKKSSKKGEASGK